MYFFIKTQKTRQTKKFFFIAFALKRIFLYNRKMEKSIFQCLKYMDIKSPNFTSHQLYIIHPVFLTLLLQFYYSSLDWP